MSSEIKKRYVKNKKICKPFCSHFSSTLSTVNY
jgi:hypothetical protein